MAYQCWTCGSEQNSRKFLKNHVATEHKHLSIICPYCYPKETTLGRISDLKKHVEKKHPNIYDSLHKSFFSEGNGFYLCHYPQEYVRHVSPTQPSSDEARQAMEALKLVIPALNTPSRELQQWESGWLQAVGTPLRDDSVNQSSPHVVDECGNQFIATKVTPGYSPSRPEMLELTDDIVYFDSSALECIVSDNDLMYYVKLLTRPSLYQNVIGVPPSHYGNNRRQVRGQDYYEMSSKVASTFNICQFNVGEIYLISPISVRAVSLLYSGCMPLFPPALRDWSIPEWGDFKNKEDFFQSELQKIF